MALIDDVRTSLRTKSNALDSEITDLIDACKLDLGMAGVEVIEETDTITKQAIKLYCKGSFGYDENSEKFMKAYESLKISMALCGDYKKEVV